MPAPSRILLLSFGPPRPSIVYGLLDLFETAATCAKAKNLPGLIVRHSHGADSIAATKLNPTSDAVIVVPRQGDPAPNHQALLQALRDTHQQGALIGSVCMGTFDLAETGILDGRRATTHWKEAERFSARFPRVHMDSAQILIDEGDVVTAGGMMAWTDLGLNLVQRYLGPSVMLETARMLLTDPGGREQRFYAVFHANLAHNDPAILEVQHEIHKKPEHRWTVPDMAERAKLGERTFIRRFKTATNETPLRYVLLTRIARARDHLETTRSSVSDIAWDLGYQDVNAFRKVFFDLVGLTPSDYRKRFKPFRTF